jgi:hypothetical protein
VAASPSRGRRWRAGGAGPAASAECGVANCWQSAVMAANVAARDLLGALQHKAHESHK